MFILLLLELVILFNLLYILSRYEVVSINLKHDNISLVVRPEFNDELIKYSKNEINHFPIPLNEKENDLLSLVMDHKSKEEDTSPTNK